MKAYSIYNAHGEDERPDIAPMPLDGDYKKIQPLGYEFDKVANLAVHEDGTFVWQHQLVQGVRIDPTHLPTRMLWGGGDRRPLMDVQAMWGAFLVRENFRQVMERLEPGRHQFEPVNLVWKDGTSEGAGRYYWFIPLARVDGMDREKTTMLFQDKVQSWMHVPGGKYVVNWSQVGDHVIWYDPCVGGSWLWVSEVFKREMDAAGVTGIGYHEAPAV